MTFAERLRELRQLNNITQIEMANKLGLNRVTYTNYEREKSEPSISTLKKIATIFNVSIDYLIAFEDDTKGRNNRKKLLLGLEAELKKINRTFELEIKSLLIDLLNLIKTNQLSSSDVKKWLIDINEKDLECSSELLRFISEMPKDFDPIFDVTDIYQILNSNDK
ncbi:HTH-type transcriptional regulator ImmR [Streptococcus parauberis]|uniref:helix-turn-helix domain-containing protein n=1 Tax=Streptococcus parauberis TaxID=1348 RepID=UPI000CCDB7F3|nr:helix-turn-helix transcriptional regulator [Streptococcus parauberis]PNY21715.1 HTH-type transcriptional regulator ImmR [Streptococcus parauberis]